MGAVDQQELHSVTGRLGDIVRLARVAMSRATTALLATDAAVDDSVLAADRALHALRHEVDDHAAAILATRGQLAATAQPAIVASVHINADVERMGDLARQTTDIARSRRPIPLQPQAILREMSQICLDLATQAGDIVQSPSAELDGHRDTIRRLEQLYERLLSDSASVDVGTATDVTLVGRFCVRYAGHAVSVARHAELLTVGAPDK